MNRSISWADTFIYGSASDDFNDLLKKMFFFDLLACHPKAAQSLENFRRQFGLLVECGLLYAGVECAELARQAGVGIRVECVPQ